MKLQFDKVRQKINLLNEFAWLKTLRNPHLFIVFLNSIITTAQGNIAIINLVNQGRMAL